MIHPSSVFARPACLLLFSLLTCLGAVNPSTAANPLIEHVEYLASEELGGRRAGTPGEALAIEYIAREFESLGLQPLPQLGDFVAPLEIGRDFVDSGSQIVFPGVRTSESIDSAGGLLEAVGMTDAGWFDGPLVFAGYGISTAEAGPATGVRSYQGLRLEGKAALIVDARPTGRTDDEQREILSASRLSARIASAETAGASALVIATDTLDSRWRRLTRGDQEELHPAIPVLLIDRKTIEGRLGLGHSQALTDIAFSLDRAAEDSRYLPPRPRIERVRILARNERVPISGANVLAWIPAAEDAGSARWIVVSAHHDHLGQGLWRRFRPTPRDRETATYYGADDNASGVAALLGVARRLAQGPPLPVNVLLATWTAEEMGLVGSRAFVADPPIALEDIIIVLNCDMVGRMRDDELFTRRLARADEHDALLRTTLEAYGVRMTDLVLSRGNASDSDSFAREGVAAIDFFTGFHPDYHEPGDTVDKINAAGLETVSAAVHAFARAVAHQVAGEPAAAVAP